MRTFIYCLVDPRDHAPKYIGKSNKPERRYEEHLIEKRVNKKCNWIKSLKALGLKPNLEILDEIEHKEWKFWEMHYISLYKSWGFELKNGTNGGDGGVDEIIAKKISLKLTGRKSPPGARGKAIATRQKRFKETGKWAKDGTYVKVASTLKGQTRSQKVKDQMSASAKKAFKEGRRVVQGGAGISRPGKLNPGSRGIAQYNLQGNFIKEWESAKQAGESFSASNPAIIKCCKGKGLTAYKFIWRYIDPRENEELNVEESIRETIFKIEQRKQFCKKNMQKQQLLKWV